MATRIALLSAYSLCYSTLRSEALFSRLDAWGIERVAITDLDSLSGYPLLRSLAKERDISLFAGAASWVG